jgi:hypothetical protein
LNFETDQKGEVLVQMKEASKDMARSFKDLSVD